MTSERDIFFRVSCWAWDYHTMNLVLYLLSCCYPFLSQFALTANRKPGNHESFGVCHDWVLSLLTFSCSLDRYWSIQFYIWDLNSHYVCVDHIKSHFDSCTIVPFLVLFLLKNLNSRALHKNSEHHLLIVRQTVRLNIHDLRSYQVYLGYHKYHFIFRSVVPFLASLLFDLLHKTWTIIYSSCTKPPS